jgi:hypothetical protein
MPSFDGSLSMRAPEKSMSAPDLQPCMEQLAQLEVELQAADDCSAPEYPLDELEHLRGHLWKLQQTVARLKAELLKAGGRPMGPPDPEEESE